MMAIVTLVLDVLIVGLLAATIIYAVMLNRRLTQLRDSRGELDVLVRGFAEAAARADSGVKGMQKVASEAGEELQKTIGRAKSLRDELQFILEAADAVANRLEASASGERRAPAETTRGSSPVVADALRAAAALAGGGRPKELEPPPLRPAAASRTDGGRTDGGRTEGGRSEVGRSESARAEARRRPTPPAESPGEPAREERDGLSRAERELLQALENRR
ncbi:MAG: hypothetical protein GC191_15015 [Azospirillum sp.]|nr:hypothetical protein [Azospirillum sp.]